MSIFSLYKTITEYTDQWDMHLQRMEQANIHFKSVNIYPLVQETWKTKKKVEGNVTILEAGTGDTHNRRRRRMSEWINEWISSSAEDSGVYLGVTMLEYQPKHWQTCYKFLLFHNPFIWSIRFKLETGVSTSNMDAVYNHPNMHPFTLTDLTKL
jgi:hypothetical protein